MSEEVKMTEQEAYQFLAEEKFDQAFALFKKAAEIYKRKGNHKEAALCLASAASCWDLKSGQKTFSNSAQSYKEAAREAQKAGDLQYASLLYRHAAISFERDIDFLDFSDCFYRSRECFRKFLTQSLFSPGKIRNITSGRRKKRSLAVVLANIFQWFSLSFSALIWGHGERPARTFYAGFLLIFLSAVFYKFSYLTNGKDTFRPDLIKALYFSVVTFTTVGYGDLIPLGISKLVAMVEAFCGIFIMPLFIIGLSKKYLRV